MLNIVYTLFCTHAHTHTHAHIHTRTVLLNVKENRNKSNFIMTNVFILHLFLLNGESQSLSGKVMLTGPVDFLPRVMACIQAPIHTHTHTHTRTHVCALLVRVTEEIRLEPVPLKQF